MASMSITRRKSRDKEDDDSDLCSSSSSFEIPCKRRKKQTKERKKERNTIPREVSMWTEHDLKRLNISYSNYIFSSPDELIDQFELIKVNVPALDEDFVRIYEYLQSKLKFIDFPSEENLRCLQPSNVRTSLLKKLKTLLTEWTTPENEEHQKLKQNLKKESQYMVDIIRVSGSKFIIDLINFLAENHPFLLKTAYTSIWHRFGDMCDFNGSFAFLKQNCDIFEVLVSSVPDLVFMKPWVSRRKLLSGNYIISVAEFMEYDIEVPVQTRSSDSGAEITVPQNKRGLIQHIGQLLLANPSSFFPWHSLGIVINETKVLFTCLAMTDKYFDHVDRALNQDDKGVVYTCGPYNLLKASDRQIVLKTFLRLGLTQQNLVFGS